MLNSLNVATISTDELYKRILENMSEFERNLSTLIDSNSLGWADHVEICACSRLFKVVIIVVDLDILIRVFL